jgi:hypothetical protein
MAKGEYPGPKFGLEFWTNKEANLRLITQQLESEQLRKVRPTLTLTLTLTLTPTLALALTLTLPLTR